MNTPTLDSFKENNITVDVAISIGSADLKIEQLLRLGRGSVVELSQKPEDYVNIFANNVLIARGEIVVTNKGTIAISVVETIK